MENPVAEVKIRKDQPKGCISINNLIRAMVWIQALPRYCPQCQVVQHVPWHCLYLLSASKNAVLLGLYRGCKRRGQKAAFLTAQEVILYRTGEQEKQLIVSQIFRQAVLSTVQKILYGVHLGGHNTEYNFAQISTAKYTPENVRMTLAWIPPDPPAAGTCQFQSLCNQAHHSNDGCTSQAPGEKEIFSYQ